MAVTKIIRLAVQESLKIEVLTHALSVILPVARPHLTNMTPALYVAKAFYCVLILPHFSSTIYI